VCCWFVTAKHRVRLYENRVLCGMSEPKTEEERGLRRGVNKGWLQNV